MLTFKFMGAFLLMLKLNFCDESLYCGVVLGALSSLAIILLVVGVGG